MKSERAAHLVLVNTAKMRADAVIHQGALTPLRRHRPIMNRERIETAVVYLLCLLDLAIYVKVAYDIAEFIK